MAAARKRAQAPIKWRWLAAVRELVDADETLTTPRRATTMLVALCRAEHADADGRNCYPSQRTLATFAYTTRPTVRQVDEWSVRVGVLVLTKNAGRGASKRYRLVVPPSIDDRDHDHSTDGKMVVTTTTQAELDGRQDGRHEGRDDDHDHLTPNVSEEEEEGADAPLPDGRVAAPVPAEPFGLFGDDPDPVSSVASPTGLDGDIRVFVDEIARCAGMTLDAGTVGPALAEAVARAGLCGAAVVVHCIETLKRNSRSIREPSPWLVKHLNSRINANLAMSPRMDAAAVLEALWDLDDEIAAAGIDLGHDAPEVRVRSELADAGLIDDAWDGIPDVWDIKPAYLAEFARIVRSVILSTSRRSDDRARDGRPRA